MNINPYLAPEKASQSTVWDEHAIKRWSIDLTAGFFIVLDNCAFIALLLMPNYRHSPEAARRFQCMHNLREIALALRNYHDEHQEFPPAYTVDAAGKPLHSWRTLILPYMEQAELYKKIDLTKPWDDPANKAAYDSDIRYFSCPSLKLPKGHTNYLAVVGEDACFQGAQPRKLSEITDDHGRTLMVVEVSAKQSVHWMQPTDCDEQLLAALLRESKPPHFFDVQTVHVDGRVRSIYKEIDRPNLHAMVTINGNDDRLVEE